MGTHDFEAFSARERGHERNGSTIRTISILSIDNCPTHETSVVDGLLSPKTKRSYGPNPRQMTTNTFQILVTGNRFMYKMVRILVGAVILVGMGKESLESVHAALNIGDKRYKLCAPAHGLALVNVSYPTSFMFSWRRSYSNTKNSLL